MVANIGSATNVANVYVSLSGMKKLKITLLFFLCLLAISLYAVHEYIHWDVSQFKVKECNKQATLFPAPRIHCVCPSQPSRAVSLSDNTTESKAVTLQTYLFTMVISAPKNKDKRNAIRETWMNSLVVKDKQFLVKFVVGTFNLSNKEEESLLIENRKHNDMLLLTDHLDSYNNLTRKVLRMFVWADHNVRFSYLLKTDDDGFADLDGIESELRERPTSNSKPLYWGYFARNLTPQKEGKWKEEKWRVCDNYLPYMLGGGYVLAAKLVHRIAASADDLILFNSEDVSVGAWLGPFELESKDDPRFDLNRFVRLKCDHYLLLTNQTTTQQRKRYSLLSSTGFPCETEQI